MEIYKAYLHAGSAAEHLLTMHVMRRNGHVDGAAFYLTGAREKLREALAQLDAHERRQASETDKAA